LKLGELRDRNWSIVACSVIDGKGISEGMDWLVLVLNFVYFFPWLTRYRQTVQSDS
jgi:ADP-ribosylation factor-like protein 1